MANKGEKYVIEHVVSVPGARTLTKYPWRQMKVGDSFVASYEERLELWAEDGEGNKVKLEIGDSDGIGCRDETIRLLDETLQQVRPENLAARIALAEKYAARYDGDDRQDIKTDVLNAIYWAWRAK